MVNPNLLSKESIIVLDTLNQLLAKDLRVTFTKPSAVVEDVIATFRIEIPDKNPLYLHLTTRYSVSNKLYVFDNYILLDYDKVTPSDLNALAHTSFRKEARYEDGYTKLAITKFKEDVLPIIEKEMK